MSTALLEHDNKMVPMGETAHEYFVYQRRLVQSMCDLWSTKWNRDRWFFFENCRFIPSYFYHIPYLFICHV